MKPFETTIVDGVEHILVPTKEWEKLYEREKWLFYLEAAGVDNWEGYEYALEMRDEAELEDNS